MTGWKPVPRQKQIARDKSAFADLVESLTALNHSSPPARDQSEGADGGNSFFPQPAKRYVKALAGDGTDARA